VSKNAAPSDTDDSIRRKVRNSAISFVGDDKKSTVYILPKIYESRPRNATPDGLLDANISASKRRPTINDRISFHMKSDRSLRPVYNKSKRTVNVLGIPGTMAEKSQAQSSGRLLAVPGQQRATPKHGSSNLDDTN
jgi:hypothetical protein